MSGFFMNILKQHKNLHNLKNSSRVTLSNLKKDGTGVYTSHLARYFPLIKDDILNLNFPEQIWRASRT